MERDEEGQAQWCLDNFQCRASIMNGLVFEKRHEVESTAFGLIDTKNLVGGTELCCFRFC